MKQADQNALIDEIRALLSALEYKDIAAGYHALLRLEKISNVSNLLYPFTELFVSMTESKSSAIRIRGFRLFCKQAQWDSEKKIEKYLDRVLILLHDENAVVVRQALASLPELLRCNPSLQKIIREAVSSIDYGKYKESMADLIARDIKNCNIDYSCFFISMYCDIFRYYENEKTNRFFRKCSEKTDKNNAGSARHHRRYETELTYHIWKA